MKPIIISGYFLVQFLSLSVTSFTISNIIPDSSDNFPNSTLFSAVSIKKNFSLYNFYHFCSGSILSKEWILTAGHCFFNKYAIPLENFSVDVGGVNLSGNDGVRHKISEFIIHPNHTQSVRIYRDDLCLVRLAKPINFSKKLQPVRVGAIRDQLGRQVLAGGWGRVSQYGKLNKKLRYVEFDTLGFEECQRLHQERNNIVDRENHICGFKGQGTSLCFGDSGGPVFDAVTGRLVAVFSTLEDCSGKYPVLFMKIQKYLKWINEVTKLDLAID